MLFSLRRLLVLVIFLVAFSVNAQQVHFIYLQTENGKPFYVKLDNKVVSSSINGYVILPKLTDGDYNVIVGFPKKEFPDETFAIKIDKMDEGFLLKNFDEKGWGLFDMQTYSVTMGGNKDTQEIVKPSAKGDSFSKMLANVVKDSSILRKNEPESDNISQINIDSPVGLQQSVSVDSQLTMLSPAIKVLSKKNDDGMEMVYVDHNKDNNDTIQIFMPYRSNLIKSDSVDKEVLKIESMVKHEVIAKPVTDSILNVTDQTKEDKSDSISAVVKNPSLQINNSNNNDSIVTDKVADVSKGVTTQIIDSVQLNNIPGEAKKDTSILLPKVVKSSVVNSDCKGFANDGDFLKLRKKMASENSDDEMVSIAKKAFHSKCFSTEQVKNLSFLFLTNEGKYKFFDLSYPFVSDSDQYYTLQSQLTDSYYINRFKAMINK